MHPLLDLTGCNHYAIKIDPNQKSVMFILTNAVVMGIVTMADVNAILDGVRSRIAVKVSLDLRCSRSRKMAFIQFHELN